MVGRLPLLAAMLLGLAPPARGHMLGKSFVIYELPDEWLGVVDLHDGSIGEWEALMGAPSLSARPDWVSPTGYYETATRVVPYSVSDGDWRVWLAWSRSTSRVYCAMERRDDVQISSYAGDNVGDIWRSDSVSLLLDGDHSGGEYGFLPHLDSDVCCASDAQYQLANNSQAQQYWAIAEPPDVGYLGAGAEWVNRPPYAEVGGMVTPVSSVLEFYVTAFDSLVWDSPHESSRSEFCAGKVIGFELEVWEHDDPSGESPLLLQLGGQAGTWRFAERFVDGVLVPLADPSSSVGGITWGRIKASFRRG